MDGHQFPFVADRTDLVLQELYFGVLDPQGRLQSGDGVLFIMVAQYPIMPDPYKSLGQDVQ